MYHWISTILEARRILQVVSHFNLSVLANETLSVSFCREIDNVFGAVGTCFDHVLSKFSGFSWERILFLKSACANKGWCKFKFKLEILEEFFMNPPGSVEDLKKIHFVWDSADTFYGFWFTLQKQWRRICSVEWRSHGRHSPRFACLLALFTLARIACLLHICVKTSRFHYSIWVTPK